MTESSSAGKPVVVGVTRSEASREAVRWAADLARRRDLPLRLVHAQELPPGLGARTRETPGEAGGEPRQGPVMAAHVRAAGEAVLHTGRAAAGSAVGAQVSHELVHGRPAHVLREAAEDAAVLVLGKRTSTVWEAAMEVGGLASALVGHLPCPLAVVRDGREEPRSRTVVLGVDGSAVSEAAVAFAFEEASLVGGELLAVEVRPARAAGRPDFLDESLLDISEALAGWRGKYPDVPVRQEVLTGHPAHMLATAAENAHVLVVGTRGRGGFRGALLGSTSRVLVHVARGPVVIVPPTTAG